MGAKVHSWPKGWPRKSWDTRDLDDDREALKKKKKLPGCEGRIHSLYTRRGTPARWFKVGEMCLECHTFWATVERPTISGDGVYHEHCQPFDGFHEHLEKLAALPRISLEDLKQQLQAL